MQCPKVLHFYLNYNIKIIITQQHKMFTLLLQKTERIETPIND